MKDKGKALKLWLVEHNMTATELAEKLGIARGNVYKYCSGERYPCRQIREKMRELGINIFD